MDGIFQTALLYMYIKISKAIMALVVTEEIT